MNAMMTKVKGFLSRTSWQIQKHSPELLMITGVVGTIAGVITACRATVKASDVIEEHKKQIAVVHKCADAGKTGNGEEYTPADTKKDTTIIYVQTGLKLVKLYAPSVILVGGSLAGMVCSNYILHKRLEGLAVAYAGLAQTFKAYRARVAEKYGVEEEQRLRHNIRAGAEITEMTGELDESGEEKIVTHTVNVADDDDYTAFFDESSLCWEKGDPEYNLDFLNMEQTYLNKILRARAGKPVFLNEVRERLGLPKTQSGQVVGWTYEPNNPKHVGDNFIDFGLKDVMNLYKAGKYDESPFDRSFLLDFNVDGNVMYAVS